MTTSSSLPALGVTDLTVIENEPRVRDIDLGRRLSFARDRDIRKLIAQHLPELETHGPARRIGALVDRPQGGKVTVQEYWLNEPQALLICMFSETAQAAEVRRQVIGVFLAWRRGELKAVGQQREDEVLTLEAVQRRLNLLEQAARLSGVGGAANLLGLLGV